MKRKFKRNCPFHPEFKCLAKHCESCPYKGRLLLPYLPEPKERLYAEKPQRRGPWKSHKKRVGRLA